MQEIFRELYRRNKVLALSGWLHVAALSVTASVALIDSRTVLGINAWIKPLKFQISALVYLWTIAWFTGYLPRRTRPVAIISWGIATAIVVENVLLALQSARGVASHFNVSTPLDQTVYLLMGVFILANTVFVGWLLRLFLRWPTQIDPVYLVGIRLGLALFLLGSLQGFIIGANGAHAVGVSDGGPGLRLLNWSTTGGDLRVAHFMLLHALQLIPLFGFALRFLNAPRAAKLAMLTLTTLVYFAVSLGLLAQALAGQPLFEA